MTVLKADALPKADQLDAVSSALLPVVRHFLDAFLRPESFGWSKALPVAVGVWGEGRGLSIANGVQVFLAALLKNRPVPVIYIDPLDIGKRHKLTSDEVDILALVAAMRADKTAQARDIITRLTGGEIPERLVRTGLKLAMQLDPTGQPYARTRAPRLEVVRN